MADVSSVPFINYAGQQADAQLTRAQTGVAQQQAGLVGQQAQAAGLSNQITRAQLPLIMHALSDYSDDSSNVSGEAPTAQPAVDGTKQSAAPDKSGVAEDPNTSWYNPDTIDAGLRQQLFVPPVTPQEAKKIQQAALLSDKFPGLLENAKMQRQMRVDQQTAASQYTANNGYEALSAVVDADQGRAMAQLEAIAPDTVAKIRNQLPDAADEDAAARAYAAHVAGTMHQYTGRKSVARADGVYVDEVTGRPIPGVEKSGLSEDQWANLAKAGNALVDVPDGQGHTTKIEQWRANQAPSLSAWVMQQAAHGGEWGAQPTIGGAPKAVAMAGANAGIVKAKGATATADNLAGSPKAGTTTTNGKPDPVLSKALADPDYNFNPPGHKFGTTLSPDEQDIKNKQADAAVSLKKDMDAAIPAAQTAQTFYRAAQDILDSKGATAGKWSGVIAHAASWVPGLDAPASTNYQELSKYLGNAALQAGKQIFPKMTDKASALSLEKLNPSPNMTDPAIRNMLQLGTRMAQYTIDGAGKVGAYLRTGKDATRFQSWLNKYYDMPTAVNGPKEGAPAAGATQKYSDAQIAKWAQTHGVDPAKARTFLLGSK